MTHAWKVFCRTVLEQSCVVWGPGFTQENKDELKRTQKIFAKMLQNLDSLDEQIHILCMNLAKNVLQTKI